MRFDGPQSIMKAQPRLQIREGMTLNEVRKYGSEGQKLAASLFDSEFVKNSDGKWVRDGIFTKSEAEHFNNYNFSVKNNVFTMYNRKTGQTTEIKYNDINNLKKLLNDDTNATGCISYWDKNKQKVFIGENTIGGKITIDLTNNSITADGVKGNYIYASGQKVVVKNSDVKTVGTHAKELELQNTKDYGLIYNSSTEVEAGKNTIVKIDDKSDVKIKREQE